MIARQTDEVAAPQLDLTAARPRHVIEYGDHIVAVLTDEVVDVVKRAKAPRGVREPHLHELVGEAAHIRWERAHQVLALGQKVHVQDDALRRAGRVALAQRGRLGVQLVEDEFVVGVPEIKRNTKVYKSLV